MTPTTGSDRISDTYSQSVSEMAALLRPRVEAGEDIETLLDKPYHRMREELVVNYGWPVREADEVAVDFINNILGELNYLT
jgi:hypothetical protein